MANSSPEDRKLAREARVVAVVIAVTMILWMGAQWIGAQNDWDTSYAFLFDLAALAALFWAIVVVLKMWRRRRSTEK